MMSNLNGLRKLISLAMREGDKSVTVSTETASMIVVEYEKHRVAAKDLKMKLKRCQQAYDAKALELAERDDDEGQS